MRFRHLGLPVRDRELSRAFYAKYFGFAVGKATEYPDDTLIIRSGDGFDLALHPDPEHGKAPDFLHFGFACETREEAGEMLERLRADGVEIVEECDEPTLFSFKCLDPDGYRVEVYWESL
ncbi:VOC family protein [Nonomuraea sp. NPDC050556]|uniref:VOC family protein n=1 Tax=Nonomuraea sp. NPDC050556 TaxID=3364369 RepID=UPI00379FBA8A